MKKGRKAIAIMGLAIIIAGMMCIQGSVHAITSSFEIAKDTTTKYVAINNPMPKAGALNNPGNVLISSDNPDGDDIHPKITMTSAGTLVVVYEKKISMLDIPNPIWYSEDSGQSWTMQFEHNSADQGGSGVFVNPDIVYNPNEDEIFVGLQDPVTADMAFSFWYPGDIASATTYKGGVQWVADTQTDIGVTYVGEWMVQAMIDDSYSEQGLTLTYVWWDDDDETFKLPSDVGYGAYGSYYDGESILDTSPSSNIELDAGSSRMYMVFQHENDTTGRSEIGYKYTVTDLDPNSDTFLFIGGGGPGGMDKYADIEVWPWQGYFGSGELFDSRDPDVATSGSNAAIVYMTNDNIFGDWDIHCAYTNDDGETWDISVVAENHPVDDTNPAVYMTGNTVFCAYVSEGNLYLVESGNGGATWGDPEQINEEAGSVVAEEGTIGLDAGGIVWTDNRDGHKNIYYESLPVAIINVESIAGGMGITATVTNTGTVDATDVPWSIDVSGLVFLGGHAEGTIDLPAGGEATISSGLVFGIGPGTIVVNAGGASKTASCFVLGPLVLGVK